MERSCIYCPVHVSWHFFHPWVNPLYNWNNQANHLSYRLIHLKKQFKLSYHQYHKKSYTQRRERGTAGWLAKRDTRKRGRSKKGKCKVKPRAKTSPHNPTLTLPTNTQQQHFTPFVCFLARPGGFCGFWLNKSSISMSSALCSRIGPCNSNCGPRNGEMFIFDVISTIEWLLFNIRRWMLG